MKVFTVLSGMAFFILVLTLSSFAETRYVEIKKPFASVYEYLDPKSQILVQATKKDHFELVYEGTSWYQVKVKNNFPHSYQLQLCLSIITVVGGCISTLRAFVPGIYSSINNQIPIAKK